MGIIDSKTAKGLQKMIVALRIKRVCFERNQGDFYEESAVVLKRIESKFLPNSKTNIFQA
ncbi:hypothetical protein BWD12_09445 [Leptospira santarosai serovar Bananal]|uniref:Uncharacterized protein n=1 Tax=Leptospira santarosai TaxID=28183 RepID=A0AB73LNS9_9LEPT|nr:hypothetical protein BWD11_14675 [Leptospira santarosai serovar Grippotyphosa]ONF79462.1 hypothetical protein BWD12_09445 [Leptospira santarosai serovar Bananal]ONF86199.1 hypothetical protein BWD13_10350 [Leptospira santarosai serovar Grippotyphosa]ONF93913.1 hypothetical protein BWD14_04525 [Leptospira santarosai]